MIITWSDARQVMYCSKGIRVFCTKYHIDYDDFLKNGIEADKLAALNDSMADKIIEVKRGRK